MSVAITYWIVGKVRPTDDLQYVYPGFGFAVMGEEVPGGIREGRVIFPADGSSYDPTEFSELAAALGVVGHEPGVLPDWRALSYTDPSWSVESAKQHLTTDERGSPSFTRRRSSIW